MPLKERIRSGIPLTLVISLGLAWTWVTWSDYSGQIVQPGGVATELVLRYYDRGLRVSEAGKRGNAYERWMAGTDTKKEWLEESRGTIRNLYLADLGEPGEGILDAIALRLGEPVTPPVGSDDPGYRRKMKDFLLAGHGQAWQFELFLHTKNDPEILAKYRSENDRLLARAMWTGSLDNAMLLFSSVVAAPVFEEIAFRGGSLPGAEIQNRRPLGSRHFVRPLRRRPHPIRLLGLDLRRNDGLHRLLPHPPHRLAENSDRLPCHREPAHLARRVSILPVAALKFSP